MNGHAEANVASGTEGYDTPKRERVLFDAELAALWAVTAEPTDFNLIVRLMLWTGCRRSEIGSLRWSEIVDGELRIPGSRTEKHRPLMLPMPHQMRAALEALRRRLGREHLFGHGPHGFQAWSQSKRRLDARLGFDETFDLHDLRRSVETRMAEFGSQRTCRPRS